MRSLLFFLLCVTGFTAFVSGILMVSAPGGEILQLPPQLLEGTPFRDYLAPGLLLAILVGCPLLVAVFLNLMRHRLRYNWALAGGFLLAAWITVQVIMIQTLHWLHMVYFLAGILIMLLAYQLKGKWAV